MAVEPAYDERTIALFKVYARHWVSFFKTIDKMVEVAVEDYSIRARFVFAWETGMRPESIDALRAPENYRKGADDLTLTDDIDKNRYGRGLPLTARAREALDSVCPDNGLIFGAHEFRPQLRQAARAIGLPEHLAAHVTEHCFRHSRITYWAEVKPNLPGIQYLAGHTQPSTTAKYIKASRRAAEEVLAASETELARKYWGANGARTKNGGTLEDPPFLQTSMTLMVCEEGDSNPHGC